MSEPTGSATQAATKLLRDAFAAAVVAVEAEPDAENAYRGATDLRATMDDLAGHAAVLRAVMAYRLQTAEALSLAQLAERLGTSKARADQLIRVAKTSLDTRAET